MQYRWKLKPDPNAGIVSHLKQTINVSEPIATILAQRNISTFDEAKLFFRPQSEINAIHNPFWMKNMDKAVERLTHAIDNQERIMLFGDYDVDGTTSVALCYTFLKDISNNLTCYIPDRYAEGYGISFLGIDVAAQNGITLIIALDCGIKSIDKVEYASKKGIHFIICDHHNPGEKVPNAYAVLDPKQKDCQYPFKELSGCGVGFKLMQGYAIQNPEYLPKLETLYDFLVVSIGADLVPVVGENRVLASLGIEKLNRDASIGLRALMIASGFSKDFSITDVVFKLAPRINAAGRVAHASAAVDLLISDDLEQATEFAKKLNEHNTDRRDLDQSITEEALEMIRSNPLLANSKSTVLFNENWHKGVVGIVASRCIESFYRPTIILTESNGMATGSARSVAGFDLYEAICECEDLLEQFGGHTHAAGMSLKVENVPLLQEKFEQVVKSRITPDQEIASIDIDCEIGLDEINFKLCNVINQMSPFGPGNMTPVFVSRNLELVSEPKLLKEQHIKLRVKQGNSPSFDAIGFRMADKLDEIQHHSLVDICYTIEENVFNDKTTLQLVLKDVKASKE